MKSIWKWVGAGTVGSLLLATTPTEARAGHRDAERAAAIIGGIAAVGVIAAIASGHHADVQVSYGYNTCPPPPPRRHWVSGHYEIRRERVVRPGYWETVVEPAEYAWVKRHGCRVYVEVKPECRRRVWVSERVEWVETRVWVPGCWGEEGRYARAY